jgi:transposase
MSRIPTRLTEAEVEQHVSPYLSKAKRGYVCKIPLYKVFNYILYLLHTGCQWKELPIDPDPVDSSKREISHDAGYYHFRKWSKDGSLKEVWEHSIDGIRDRVDMSELSLDGSHTIAKKGESP